MKKDLAFTILHAEIAKFFTALNAAADAAIASGDIAALKAIQDVRRRYLGLA